MSSCEQQLFCYGVSQAIGHLGEAAAQGIVAALLEMGPESPEELVFDTAAALSHLKTAVLVYERVLDGTVGDAVVEGALDNFPNRETCGAQCPLQWFIDGQQRGPAAGPGPVAG